MFVKSGLISTPWSWRDLTLLQLLPLMVLKLEIVSTTPLQWPTLVDPPHLWSAGITLDSTCSSLPRPAATRSTLTSTPAPPPPPGSGRSRWPSSSVGTRWHQSRIVSSTSQHRRAPSPPSTGTPAPPRSPPPRSISPASSTTSASGVRRATAPSVYHLRLPPHPLPR